MGQEDLLKKGMATHTSILAWRILRTEEPGGLQSTGSQRVRTRLGNTDALAGCVVPSKSLSLSESLVLNLHNEENPTSLIEFF